VLAVVATGKLPLALTRSQVGSSWSLVTCCLLQTAASKTKREMEGMTFITSLLHTEVTLLKHY
jgi:hypothetical protein